MLQFDKTSRMVFAYGDKLKMNITQTSSNLCAAVSVSVMSVWHRGSRPVGIVGDIIT
jgi:hypothetical protein